MRRPHLNSRLPFLPPRVRSLFENLCFLVGSAYFVAGSYPELPEAGAGDLEADGADDTPDDGSVSTGTYVSNPAHATVAMSSSGGGGHKKRPQLSTGSDESLLSAPFMANEHG